MSVDPGSGASDSGGKGTWSSLPSPWVLRPSPAPARPHCCRSLAPLRNCGGGAGGTAVPCQAVALLQELHCGQQPVQRPAASVWSQAWQACAFGERGSVTLAPSSHVAAMFTCSFLPRPRSGWKDQVSLEVTKAWRAQWFSYEDWSKSDLPRRHRPGASQHVAQEAGGGERPSSNCLPVSAHILSGPASLVPTYGHISVGRGRGGCAWVTSRLPVAHFCHRPG